MRAKTYAAATAYRDGYHDGSAGLGPRFIALYLGGSSLNDYERGYIDSGHGRAAESIWDDAVAPGGLVCAVCREPVESEPCPYHQWTALEPAGACAHEFTRPASVDGPDRLCVSCLDYLPAPAHSP